MSNALIVIAVAAVLLAARAFRRVARELAADVEACECDSADELHGGVVDPAADARRRLPDYAPADGRASAAASFDDRAGAALDAMQAAAQRAGRGPVTDGLGLGPDGLAFMAAAKAEADAAEAAYWAWHATQKWPAQSGISGDAEAEGSAAEFSDEFGRHVGRFPGRRDWWVA